jgi:hypothetical protein
MRLTVRVNSELLLDAGNRKEMQTGNGREFLIHPPRKTLFNQLLDYLRAKEDPPVPLSGSFVGREGVAATAVTLRWGSYLAVLLDHEKTIWSEVDSPNTSRISDHEMARINIEASAALGDWVDLCRTDRAGEYTQLVNRAVFHLPMTWKSSKRHRGPFVALGLPQIAAQLITGVYPERLERARRECEGFPSRVFANALINSAWRNGSIIEDIHAGDYRGYPLDLRRIAPVEERQLIAATNAQLAAGMDVCLGFSNERPRRSWPDQVSPYALAQALLITPTDWTLTERSCEVRL